MRNSHAANVKLELVVFLLTEKLIGQKLFTTMPMMAKFSSFHWNDPFSLYIYCSLNDILKEATWLGTWLNDCFASLLMCVHKLFPLYWHNKRKCGSWLQSNPQMGSSKPHFTWVCSWSWPHAGKMPSLEHLHLSQGTGWFIWQLKVLNKL